MTTKEQSPLIPRYKLTRSTMEFTSVMTTTIAFLMSLMIVTSFSSFSFSSSSSSFPGFANAWSSTLKATRSTGSSTLNAVRMTGNNYFYPNTNTNTNRAAKSAVPEFRKSYRVLQYGHDKKNNNNNNGRHGNSIISMTRLNAFSTNHKDTDYIYNNDDYSNEQEDDYERIIVNHNTKKQVLDNDNNNDNDTAAAAAAGHGDSKNQMSSTSPSKSSSSSSSSFSSSRRRHYGQVVDNDIHHDDGDYDVIGDNSSSSSNRRGKRFVRQRDYTTRNDCDHYRKNYNHVDYRHDYDDNVDDDVDDDYWDDLFDDEVDDADQEEDEENDNWHEYEIEDKKKERFRRYSVNYNDYFDDYDNEEYYYSDDMDDNDYDHVEYVEDEDDDDDIPQLEWETYNTNTHILFPPSSPPKAIIHFIGGTVFGSLPKQFYKPLLEGIATLTNSCIVCTSIPITLTSNPLNHLRLCKQIARDFNHAYHDVLCDEYGGSSKRMRQVPVVGLGHSLGARLHVILSTQGSLIRQMGSSNKREGNVLLGFNNYDASLSVPGVQTLRKQSLKVDAEMKKKMKEEEEEDRRRHRQWQRGTRRRSTRVNHGIFEHRDGNDGKRRRRRKGDERERAKWYRENDVDNNDNGFDVDDDFVGVNDENHEFDRYRSIYNDNAEEEEEESFRVNNSQERRTSNKRGRRQRGQGQKRDYDTSRGRASSSSSSSSRQRRRRPYRYTENDDYNYNSYYNDDEYEDDMDYYSILDNLRDTITNRATQAQRTIMTQTNKIKSILTPSVKRLEFHPTPKEVWDAVENGRYARHVRNTLLVQFDQDEVDQSSRLARSILSTLSSSSSSSLSPLGRRGGSIGNNGETEGLDSSSGEGSKTTKGEDSREPMKMMKNTDTESTKPFSSDVQPDVKFARLAGSHLTPVTPLYGDSDWFDVALKVTSTSYDVLLQTLGMTTTTTKATSTTSASLSEEERREREIEDLILSVSRYLMDVIIEK